MQAGKFRERLVNKKGFTVIIEMAAGPNFDLSPVTEFLKTYRNAGTDCIPKGFDFTAITLPQSPGGAVNYEPSYILNQLQVEGLLEGLDCVPHLSCKDHNLNALVAILAGFRQSGIESVLALTGDKPALTQGVFDLDSIGLLRLMQDMNNEAYIKAKPQNINSVHQFFAGAAVSPFKYTEASQMQQYYKMEKKIRCGAKFLITQLGWDWRKSQELFKYLKDNQIDVPIIGNVYVLSTTTAAPRLMHDNKLTGCFVSDEFLAKLNSESYTQHIERAAQQIAMYKSLGAAGVDIGGVHNFETFITILNRANEIGSNWEQFKDNIYWPPKKGFYLYNEAGQRTELTKFRKTFSHKFFNFTHRAILDSNYRGFRAFKQVMAVLGAKTTKGPVYKFFNAGEGALKYLLFDCDGCGDCYLPENFGLCTIGGCEKGLDNPPCGDTTPEGKCGNNLERICIGELLYQRASAENGGLKRLREIINKPRKRELEGTSSILNYLFGRDHTMKNAIISIGESIHASIPKTGQIMKELAASGKDAYKKESGPLNYIRALIESQANDGADFIAVNLDAFGEDNPQTAVDMMREYVKMVRKWGKGVPVCIDSSNDEVLIAGLKEWFNTTESVRQPLINSIKIYTMDKMLPLKSQYNYAFIGLLVTEEKAMGPGGAHSVDELHYLAKRIYDKAVNFYGFKPGEIYFDTTVFPLAIDMPMEPGVPGYTYRTFETIKRIKQDPALKGVHCSLGISNSVRDLPGRRIGVCRAYVAKAMEYGLDAGIVNVAHHYGLVAPDPDLVALVDAFARMNGDAQATNRAMSLMAKFCQENRKVPT